MMGPSDSFSDPRDYGVARVLLAHSDTSFKFEISVLGLLW